MDLETLALKRLPLTGFTGIQDDGIINLVGFTGIDKEDGTVELSITNFRPSINLSTGQVLPDQAAVGPNATIEIFQKVPGRENLVFLHTLADPLVSSPNRVAVIEGKGLYVTNDHGQQKPGLLLQLSPLLGTGDVTFCPSSSTGAHNPCTVVSEGHSYPNGLLHSTSDGYIYVPSAAQGGIKVFRPHLNGSLELKHEIDLPYAIDNLSEDQNGDIWAAVFPDGISFLKHMMDPAHRIPASATFKISRSGTGDFRATKILEDRDGEVLPGSTTVVHDATTGRLFFSGMVSPFITVCEYKHR
ncbi:unnamed protein product [Discula destructiva]